MTQFTSGVSSNLSTPYYSQTKSMQLLTEKETQLPLEQISSIIQQELITNSTKSDILEQMIKKSSSNKCVFFGEGCKPLFHFLSNDFPSPMEFGGRKYTCATSAYEAQKFLGRPDLMDRFTKLNAEEAFALSAEKHLDKTPGWYEKRLDTMYHVLRAKFGQNHHLATMLGWTGDAHLSYHSPYLNMDPFWTDDSNGMGHNQMGLFLMIIRHELGGWGAVWPPDYYKEKIPRDDTQKILPTPLDKPDHEILEEIKDLNRRINEDVNKTHTTKARLLENGRYTRFKFCNFPYDQTLVPLSSGRYINASFVLNKKFIGTQSPIGPQSQNKSDSPLENTYEDFWSMVHEHNVPVVIMLNRLGDPGDDIYFPFAMNDKRKYGKLHLELIEEPLFVTRPTWRQSPHEEEPHAIIHRKIKICKEGEKPRIVHHFQYQNWRDFSAGNERAASYLVQAVDRLHLDANRGPIVVHCHAGVGRTSVVITLLDQFQHLTDGTIDIKRCVERQRDPKEGRCNSMMQSTDQYHFCYRVLRILSNSLK